MPLVSLAQAVSRATSVPVIDAGARLGLAHTSWPFLPLTSNIINRNAVPFVESLFNSVPTPAQVDELSEYLALATCCHAFDGWRYLSLSAMARMNGARNEALHFAYYAELRAAISILASSGIGVMNHKHFALAQPISSSSSADVLWFDGSTHPTTWKSLAAWSSRGATANSVVQLFDALGLNGLRWLDACRATTSASATAQFWLENWSIDLKALPQRPDDSMLRNDASYRIDLTSTALNPLAPSDVELIRDANLACLPLAYGQFDTIDMAIIYDLCRKACQSNYGYATPANMSKLWTNDVQPELEKHMSSQDAINIIDKLKTAPTTPGGKMLMTGDISNRTSEAVFCRALLLLRLASGLQRRQWQEIGKISPGGVVNWRKIMLDDYGTHSHLWDAAVPPADYLDLDADRQEADENIDKWLNSNVFVGFNLWKSQAHNIVQLCHFERLALMAVAT